MSKLSIILVVLAIALVFFQRINIGENAAENVQIGANFMAENKALKDLRSTDSGLQYKILTTGDGVIHPTAKVM